MLGDSLQAFSFHIEQLVCDLSLYALMCMIMPYKHSDTRPKTSQIRTHPYAAHTNVD